MDIQIRHVQEDDHPAIHRIMLADRTIRGTMRLPYQPFEHTRKRLAYEDGVIKLVALADGKVAGFCELITDLQTPRHRHVGEINMIVTDPALKGSGIGHALMAAMLDMADNWLQLKRVGLSVWTDNTKAIELYEEFGFAIEGTMSSYVFCDGAYLDAHIMGRLTMG